MFWLARRLKQPALAWSEQRELLRLTEKLRGAVSGSRDVLAGDH